MTFPYNSQEHWEDVHGIDYPWCTTHEGEEMPCAECAVEDAERIVRNAARREGVR